MPEKKTVERARRAKRKGNAPRTQAGEFVREEIDHVRAGEHGARSTKQAIAIGLSQARRSGVKLPPPKKGEAKDTTRAQARRDLQKGTRGGPRHKSAKRARASKQALERESRRVASPAQLSKQARNAAKKRSAKQRT